LNDVNAIQDADGNDAASMSIAVKNVVNGVDVSSGNGDLFVSLATTANTAGHGTAAFDLGFTMSQAQTWNGVAGLQLNWNLATGAFTSNNSSIAADNPTLGSYGSALTTFQNLGAAYSLSTAQFSVLAFDSTGAGTTGTAGQNVMSTANILNSTSGSPTTPGATFGPTNGALASTIGNATVSNYLSTMNSDTGMATAVGSNTATNGQNDHYNANSGMATLGSLWTGFDTNGLFGGNYSAGSNTFSGQAKAMPFFQFSASSLTSTARTSRVAFGVDLDGDNVIEFDNNGATVGGNNEYALFSLQGNTLYFNNPANPVPEPGTYAMMLAGLALLGGIARRRIS